MKIFKSNFLFYFSLVLISFVYLSLRFYHLPKLIGFRLDQGIHLLETKTMVDDHQFRLVGPMVTSKNFDGRNFFIGANYYYLLGIVGKIFQWNPVSVTGFFIVFEFIFYLIFSLFIAKKFSRLWSILVFLSLSLSPYLVAHSRFIWNPHLLPVLSILSLIFLQKFVSTKKFFHLFVASFFWGFAFSCHYSPIFWSIFFLYFLIKTKSLTNLKTYFSVLFGVILGDLPFFIFEFRHQFYNLKTFLYVYQHSTNTSQLTSHYFVFPLLIFTIYFSLLLLSKLKNRHSLNFLLITFLIINIFQFRLYPNYPSFGNIPNWIYSDQLRVADLISQKCPANFNIATTMQGDTRAYDLRYLLNIKKCTPNNVDNYPNSQELFVISSNTISPDQESVWEVSSFKPFVQVEQIKLNSGLNLYHLKKL